MSRRIFLIEDEAIIAEEVAGILYDLGYDVVGSEVNGDKALDKMANSNADLYILDINIKGSLSGIDIAHIINQKYKKPFVYLTSYSDKHTIDLVKATAPYGYIIKPFTDRDIRVAIELAFSRFDQINASTNLTISYLSNKLNIELTDREYSVMMCFYKGMSYAEVGEQLFISKNTVKTYQKRIFQSLGVKSQYELVDRLNRL